MVGKIAGRGAHQQGRRGFVAAHQQDDAVNRIAADGFFHVHAGQIAEEHRGGTQQRFAERHHRKFQRKAACFPHAALYPFGDFAEVRVAGREFGPGVADADDRAAIEQVVRPALIFHPAAVDETVAVFAAEPFLAAQFFRGHGCESPRRLRRKIVCRATCSSASGIAASENVYSRVAGGPATIFLHRRVRAMFPPNVRFAETNPPSRSIPLHRRETKRCNDISK